MYAHVYDHRDGECNARLRWNVQVHGHLHGHVSTHLCICTCIGARVHTASPSLRMMPPSGAGPLTQKRSPWVRTRVCVCVCRPGCAHVCVCVTPWECTRAGCACKDSQDCAKGCECAHAKCAFPSRLRFAGACAGASAFPVCTNTCTCMGMGMRMDTCTCARPLALSHEVH